MKKILLAVAALAFGSTIVNAADMAVKARPSPVYAAAFNWTGFYLGAQGGYGWGTSSGNLGPAGLAGGVPGPFSFDMRGWMAGGHVGANYQMGSFVLGAEGDIEGSDINGSQTYLGYTVTTKTGLLASLRGRLGFAVDRVLFYGTGGAAWGRVTSDYGFTGVAPFHSETTTRLGWTAGGGLEYAFWNNISGRVEYRYTDLGSPSWNDVANNASDTGNSVKFHAVRGGLTFRFGGM